MIDRYEAELARLKKVHTQRLLTVREAAEQISMSVSWLRKAVAAGTVPHLKIGRAVRFDGNQLVEWVSSHAHGVE